MGKDHRLRCPITLKRRIAIECQYSHSRTKVTTCVRRIEEESLFFSPDIPRREDGLHFQRGQHFSACRTSHNSLSSKLHNGSKVPPSRHLIQQSNHLSAARRIYRSLRDSSTRDPNVDGVVDGMTTTEAGAKKNSSNNSQVLQHGRSRGVELSHEYETARKCMCR